MEQLTVGSISLVILSGLGVFHGLALSIFLFIHKKGNRLSNQLLGMLLFVLSFRVGKSVLLEFAHQLHIKIIFTGLGSMLFIGPLFYLFTKSLLSRSFTFQKIHLLHFIPAVCGIGFGLWITENHVNTFSIWVFVLAFSIYYGHYLIYLFISYNVFRSTDSMPSGNMQLFKLIFYGLLIIWAVYVFNLFDEDVPYIIGPILYSIVAYTISFVVIKNRYIDKTDHEKYKSNQISESLSEDIYTRIQKLMVEVRAYKNPDLSLKTLSEQLHQSPQIISMVINQKSGKNFNTYINHHRITAAIAHLKDPKFEHYTIAAIAMESGFNSISSFNTAFKKQTGQTPQAYRNMQ